MKLMITWEIHPEKRADVLAAFAAMDLADYQSQQGPAIEVLGRWHDVMNGRGFGLCETTDAQALSSWLLNWNPAVDFEVFVVHEDAEAHAMVREHFGAQG